MQVGTDAPGTDPGNDLHDIHHPEPMHLARNAWSDLHHPGTDAVDVTPDKLIY